MKKNINDLKLNEVFKLKNTLHKEINKYNYKNYILNDYLLLKLK